jgi:DNA mismatch repair protein MutS
MTPVMEQYARIKSSYPGCMLLFRMGDFYEMFFEDAVRSSDILGIALTSRSKGKEGRIPMAGIPWHSAESYIARLIKAGVKVAVCEQLSDPRGSKGLVDRGVVEVLTPGTVMSDGMLQEKDNNYIGALYCSEDRCGVALADVSTGQFTAGEVSPETVSGHLGAFNLTELLLPERAGEGTGGSFDEDELGEGVTVTRRDDWLFDYGGCHRLLTDHFKVPTLDAFGCEDLREGICAAGALLAYLKEVRLGAVPQIRELRHYHPGGYMHLDEATRGNLELVSSPSGRDATLLGLLDHTVTPMGARLLRSWVLSPLIDPGAIAERLSAVGELHASQASREGIASALRGIRDLERLAAKVACGKAGPRDLLALGASLARIPDLGGAMGDTSSPLLSSARSALDPVPEASEKIRNAIAEDAPLQLTEGGVINRGFSPELDRLEEDARAGKEWIAGLQEMERSATGIPSLKVGFNKVFGYYIEVTRPHLKSVPEHYVRKQTLVNAERFFTPQLKSKEEAVLGAEEKIRALEYEIFCKVRDEIAGLTPRVQASAEAVAAVDALLSMAQAAVDGEYCRPEIDDGDRLEIADGRHPVLERSIGRSSFVPNDTLMDTSDRQILIITGPNMAGKSTYLRQVALIVLMGQIGSFVPASRAAYGAVDRIFTRVGASDNLFRGQSTFLVEMNETSSILHNATPMSLILLDEVGRGTSTYDGISIAWAVTEYLHGVPSVRAKTLFATHYHELTSLASTLERAVNVNVQVKEWNDRVIFLRKVVDGAADRSYGVQVARLAGLPDQVIKRAKEVLARFEGERTPLLSGSALARDYGSQYEMFPSEAREGPSDVEELARELAELDPETMTPAEALAALKGLKSRAGGPDALKEKARRRK